MSAIPISPGSPAGRSSPNDPLVIASAVVRSVRLEHAAAGEAAASITFLAKVELEGGVTISAIRIILAEPARLAIDWPEPLFGTDAAGVTREVLLSADARRQIADALARHLAFGDVGRERP